MEWKLVNKWNTNTYVLYIYRRTSLPLRTPIASADWLAWLAWLVPATVVVVEQRFFLTGHDKYLLFVIIYGRQVGPHSKVTLILVPATVE